MFNFTELAYVLNGTPIAFLNTKNNQYLSLDMSNYSFKVNGTHPYLINKEFEKDINSVYEILMSGSLKAKEVAADTLNKVKQAMKLNYFDNMELITKK